MKEYSAEDKTFTLEVQQNEDGESFIQFPQETMAELGWKEGDCVTWTDNKDGSYTLTKKATEWVLVETVSMFRQRYMVQVPLGKSDWALDTVTYEDAKEFSQKHLDETIVSHRVVSYEDALRLCDEDNEYANSWSNDHKVKSFFTSMEDSDE